VEKLQHLKKKKHDEHDDDFDYYEVLGLENLRNRATQEQIKKACKFTC
jgi:curved DNA-binding protein CbpA